VRVAAAGVFVKDRWVRTSDEHPIVHSTADVAAACFAERFVVAVVGFAVATDSSFHKVDNMDRNLAVVVVVVHSIPWYGTAESKVAVVVVVVVKHSKSFLLLAAAAVDDAAVVVALAVDNTTSFLLVVAVVAVLVGNRVVEASRVVGNIWDIAADIVAVLLN
jgi:hypothetical protein